MASLEHGPSVCEGERRLIAGVNQHHLCRVQANLTSCKHRLRNLRKLTCEYYLMYLCSCVLGISLSLFLSLSRPFVLTV